MKLYCHNKATINIAHNPIQHDKTKHTEIDKHFIKEKLKVSAICLPFVSTTQQIANILTNGLLWPNFEFLVNKLGMRHLHTNLRGSVEDLVVS